MRRMSSAPIALALLRIGLGALLLHESYELWERGVGPWIVEDTAYRVAAAPDWYAAFANKVVLKLPSLFAWLVAGGATAAGAALFIGAATRPACLGVLFLMGNALFVGPLTQREYVVLTALAAGACLIGDAGSRVGLDPFLPRWLSWSGAKQGSAKPRAAAAR